MTLLLAADAVQLFAPGSLDEAGWADPGTARAVWAGTGNLQLGPGYDDTRGHGPHAPDATQRGTLYLPADVALADGMTAVVRGQAFLCSAVRAVPDPLPGGLLGCVAATVTGTGAWGDG